MFKRKHFSSRLCGWGNMALESPIGFKRKRPREHNDPCPPTFSRMPLWKLHFARSKAMKMQVILLNWCGSNKTCKGRSGLFHVYGGHDLRSPQYLIMDFSFTLRYFLSNIINYNNVLV